ncbi:MAG TPA: hypothetical protein VJ746_04925 [Nitrospira sp.]|nr:hypothetical protein [Nitrospira sp.]
MEILSLEKLSRLIVYSIVVGLIIRLFASIWQRHFDSYIGVYERGALAGIIVGFIAFLDVEREPSMILTSVGAIIAVYFISKLVSM